MATNPDELQRRRRDINRGLSRSYYGVVATSALVGFFALAALWLSGKARREQKKAEVSAAEAQQASLRLWQASAHAAKLQRSTRAPGQRTGTLEIIREAAGLKPSRELRDEALSALLLPDVGTNLAWREELGFEIPSAYDASFEHFVQNSDRHRAIVRRASDGTVLMDEPGLGRGTPFSQFSPDGRLAAIGFYEGQLGLWDWRQKKLLAQFPSIVEPGFAEPTFDFSPDGLHLWVLTSDKLLQQHALQGDQSLVTIALRHQPRFVRLSPSGQLAAVACGKDLEVWDLSTCKLQATLTVTNEIWRVAWQPGEERLALGCEAGLLLWDIGAPNALTLRQDGTITAVFFNPEGDLLFTSGWNVADQVWSLRHPHVVLECADFSGIGLSRDQTKLAFSRSRVGHGIRQYLAPAGLRNWPAPPSLGLERFGADLDPRERWVLTGHPHGWLLRDADSGKELVRARCDLAGHVSFSSDGSNVVAWTSAGFVRWPLVVAQDGSVNVVSNRLSDATIPNEGHACSFSADRRVAAYTHEKSVILLNTDDPGQRLEIPLCRGRDNCIYLSHDGRWLITGYHNQQGLDLYDTKAGKFIRTIAVEGFANPVFNPCNGALFTCTATEYTRWNLETLKPDLTVRWRIPFLGEAFLGFSGDCRQALVKVSPSTFQLFDLETGRDFATLDFRDPQAVFKSSWSRDGQRLFLFGNDGGVTRLDLTALRHGLDGLSGLNWADEAPSREMPVPPFEVSAAPVAALSGTVLTQAMVIHNPVRLAWIIWLGLAVTIAIGLYIVRYQRRLFAGYLETEALAARRERELQLSQTALRHSEKMKALGTMATGVAHDFNNLLSIIRLSNELIEEQVQPDGTTKENFAAIQQAVQRGKGIVNSMLGYARDDGQVYALTASELISEAVALLNKSFLSGLVLQIETVVETPPLTGRKGRLGQMLLNLIVNAAEAMDGRGTLVLGARAVASIGACLLPPHAAPGYVEVFVKDTGPGIPPDVLPRIFEPFFTTKSKGAQHGTGLGLSMLYAMAREDGVGVAVDTELGRGTTFRLLLPLKGDKSPQTVDSQGGRNSPVASSP